jgi:hypothetical protein
VIGCVVPFYGTVVSPSVLSASCFHSFRSVICQGYVLPYLFLVICGRHTQYSSIEVCALDIDGNCRRHDEIRRVAEYATTYHTLSYQ